MNPIFQIDSSSPYAAKVNPAIANMQQTEQITGKTNAAAFMYTQAVSAYPGDPNANAVNGTGSSQLRWNALTETQKQILLAAGFPTGSFPSSPLPSDLVAFVQENAGPADYWNASYEQAGVVAGVAGLLPLRDAMIPGTTTRVTVLELPLAS